LKLPDGISIHFELGRSLTGQCGKIVTRVLYTKQGVGKKFVITDAGMTELMRPSLYQAVHKIKNISSSGNPETYDIVGPVCESSDVFARNATLPETDRGDLLQIFSCGAYAESMTLNYNLREKASPIYLSEGNISKGRELSGPSFHLKPVAHGVKKNYFLRQFSGIIYILAEATPAGIRMPAGRGQKS
jgi:diaminopimelate decarboxylase